MAFSIAPYGRIPGPGGDLCSCLFLSPGSVSIGFPSKSHCFCSSWAASGGLCANTTEAEIFRSARRAQRTKRFGGSIQLPVVLRSVLNLQNLLKRHLVAWCPKFRCMLRDSKHMLENSCCLFPCSFSSRGFCQGLLGQLSPSAFGQHFFHRLPAPSSHSSGGATMPSRLQSGGSVRRGSDAASETEAIHGFGGLPSSTGMPETSISNLMLKSLPSKQFDAANRVFKTWVESIKIIDRHSSSEN